MKTLKGAQVDPLEIESFDKVADLIYFEGPLLSLYRDRGNNILFHWCDNDETTNRWLSFSVGDKILEEFLKSKVTLFDILTKPKEGFLYCHDIDQEGHVTASLIVSPHQIPRDYVPSAESFYKENVKHSFSGDRLKVAIDGEWGFSDVRRFPPLLEGAYAFIYRFISRKDQGNSLPPFPMRDGFSSMHFFNQLRSLLPADWRTELEVFQ